jgi:hypothetical protein
MNQKFATLALLTLALALQTGAQAETAKAASAAVIPATSTTAVSAKSAQPAFVITADDTSKAAQGKQIDLPSAPEEVQEAKKDTGPIHIWAVRINYDSYLWGFIFLMPFAAIFFLLSNIRAYFKKRVNWYESIRKENIELPRTTMGD